MADGAERLKPADEMASHTELRLPSTLACVDTVEATALAYAEQAGFAAEMCSHLAMVAREAAVNAVVHGNCYDPRKQVTASFDVGPEGLRITLSDQGGGLDVAAIPDPLAPENLLRSSGRGIFLMKSFMDEVTFRALAPGTETTLIKRRLAAQTHLTDIDKEKKMSLKFKTRQVDGVTILDLNGRITLGDGSVTLRDAVKDALNKGDKRILLNLADVDYIDSSGIGELVSAYTSMKNAGGELKLLHLTKKVHDLLQITKLYTVFDVRDDETVAVGSFGA